VKIVLKRIAFMNASTKVFYSIVLLVYLAFTSGAIFELTKSESIDRLDIPYSAISGERTGVIGTFYTGNDIDCTKWLAGQPDKKSHIYADINGQLLLSEYIEPYTQIVEVFSFKVFFKEPYFMFLTEWNMRHGKMVWHTGQPGLREYGTLPDLSKKKLVFQKGKAQIWR
jgi:uncharacterized membrane protein